MRKRLRKKLRLGEFAELGFELRLTTKAGLVEDQLEDAIDRFIGEAIEARDLAVGGGGNGELWHFFVTRAGTGSVSGEERAAVVAWLEADGRFAKVEASPLLDAWYQTWDWDTGAVERLG